MSTEQPTPPPAVVLSTAQLSETEPHAVRWARRDVRSRFDTEYSRWHWTTDATKTLCGRRIMLIANGPALLPETRDDAEYVDCKQCRKLLPDNAGDKPPQEMPEAAVDGYVAESKPHRKRVAQDIYNAMLQAAKESRNG